MIHPMHLHGMPMQVIAQDGYLVPQPYYCDTLNIAPGQRFEVIVEPRRTRRLGLPLPHPQPRRDQERHVRDGHGAHRRGVVVRKTMRGSGKIPESRIFGSRIYSANGVGLKLTPSEFSSA